MSPSLIFDIGTSVETVIAKNYGVMPDMPEQASTKAAQAAYDLLLPQAHEDQMKALCPSWVFPTVGHFTIAIAPFGTNEYDAQYTNRLQAPLPTPRLKLPGHTILRNVQGAVQVGWRNDTMSIILADDGSKIADPDLREHVEAVMAVTNANKALREEQQKGRADMTTFLQKHKTLQKAVAEFGPALMQYVPKHVQNIYNRPVEKGAKRKAPETNPNVEVNIDYLVANAVNHQLQMTQ
jgi:hypothetical protein